MAARDEVADVLIIGSGATGAIAAMVLGQAGLNVVCLEQGGWIEAATTRTTRPTGSGSASTAGAPTSTSAKATPTTSRSAATPPRC